VNKGSDLKDTKVCSLGRENTPSNKYKVQKLYCWCWGRDSKT